MTKTIDGATLVKLLKTTTVTDRIKNGNYLLEVLQDESGEYYIDERSISNSLDYLTDSLKSWVGCSNPKVAMMALDIVSLVADAVNNNSKHYLLFLQELTETIVANLGNKSKEIRTSLVYLLKNFLLTG